MGTLHLIYGMQIICGPDPGAMEAGRGLNVTLVHPKRLAYIAAAFAAYVSMSNEGESMKLPALVCLTAASVFAAPALAAPKIATTTGAKPSAAGVLIISHKVADFAKWWPVYDGDKAARDAAGLTGCKAHQSIDDANMVVIMCDMSDSVKAKAFTSAPALKDKMTAAGVQGAPTFYFLNSGR